MIALRINDVEASPPLSRALTTVANVRSHIGGLDATDAAVTSALTGLIDAASAQIAALLGYPLARTSRVGTFVARWNGMGYFLLPSFVNIHVAEVREVGEDGVTSTQVSGWDVLPALSRVCGTFKAGEKYEVSYESGYPTSVGGVDCPHDMAHACALLASESWFTRGRSLYTTSESVAKVGSVNLAKREPMPLEVLTLLWPYMLLEL